MKVFNLCKFYMCASVCACACVCEYVSVCVLMPASLINFPLTQRKVRIAIFTFKQQIRKQFKYNTNFPQFKGKHKLNENCMNMYVLYHVYTMYYTIYKHIVPP